MAGYRTMSASDLESGDLLPHPRSPPDVKTEVENVNFLLRWTRLFLPEALVFEFPILLLVWNLEQFLLKDHPFILDLVSQLLGWSS